MTVRGHTCPYTLKGDYRGRTTDEAAKVAIKQLKEQQPKSEPQPKKG